MTEIPEHLLKRAAAARSAKSGADAPADSPAPSVDTPAATSGAPAASAPAVKAAAAPAPLPTLEDAASKAKPDIPVVAAAKRRKRVPFWAAAVLAGLPVWAVVYVAAIQPPPAAANDPMVIGHDAFVAEGCSGCHGANGEGGTGAVLNEGEINKTFADPLSVAYWLHFGADGGARADGTYGDLTREGGPHNISTLAGLMPGFPDMDPTEMAALIIYMREEMSGGDPAEDPNFNSEHFTADPAALAAMVEAVTALEAGNPDAVAGVEGAETE
ncbi:MAG: c-type cytochrome [Acidimicrobiales bacterium]|nr:c-type cytochrome [Acidimicrobiales bacterium]